MFKKLYLLVILILLTSCSNATISELAYEPLNNTQINSSKLTDAYVKSKTKKVDVLSPNLRYNPRKVIRTLVEAAEESNPKYTFNQDATTKLFQDKFNILRNSVFKERKYGIRYQFKILNESKEVIQKSYFYVKVNFQYPNKNIVFLNKFFDSSLIKPGAYASLEKEMVFNYLPQYEQSYFELHKPKKVTLNILATSRNNLGFLAITDKTLNLEFEKNS